jgi:hydroxymethylpyrimidine kinase/phosphomethylpyrimidine kinase
VLAQVLEGKSLPVIYDTVFAPSTGNAFLDEDAARRAVQVLGPCCELLTPNIFEAQILCGFTINSREDAGRAARVISQRYNCPQVLAKGGHAASIDADTCIDRLWNGRKIIELGAPRLDVPEVRGTGCMLASAIAAQRARGVAMEEAIATAKRWLAQKIQSARAIGSGRRVVVDFES